MNATLEQTTTGQGCTVTPTRAARRRDKRSQATVRLQAISALPATTKHDANGHSSNATQWLPAVHVTTEAVGQTCLATPKEVASRNDKKRTAKETIPLRSRLPSAKQGGGGQRGYDPLATTASPVLNNAAGQARDVTLSAYAGGIDKTIGVIRELHVQRVATLRMRMRLDNQIGSFVRSAMGWNLSLPEPARKKIATAAATLIAAIYAGDEISAELEKVARAVMPFVKLGKASRQPFDDFLKTLTRDMEKRAATLPVWSSWGEKVTGFGALGLAVYVGEAGDLSKYSNPSKLWNRMGLAPSWCYSMTCKDGSTANAIPRARRSRSWTIADSLLRQDNEYQKVYRERRVFEMAKDATFDKGIDPKTGKQKVSMHCDRRARRYAEKRFLLHLWRAWRDAATATA